MNARKCIQRYLQELHKTCYKLYYSKEICGTESKSGYESFSNDLFNALTTLIQLPILRALDAFKCIFNLHLTLNLQRKKLHQNYFVAEF